MSSELLFAHRLSTGAFLQTKLRELIALPRLPSWFTVHYISWDSRRCVKRERKDVREGSRPTFLNVPTPLNVFELFLQLVCIQMQGCI